MRIRSDKIIIIGITLKSDSVISVFRGGYPFSEPSCKRYASSIWKQLTQLSSLVSDWLSYVLPRVPTICSGKSYMVAYASTIPTNCTRSFGDARESRLSA